MATLADDTTLIESLRFAVPEWIREFSAAGYSTAWLVGEAKRAAVLVGTYGDVMQFASRAEPTGRQRNNRALAFNGFARGLACICLIEGSLDVYGLHWCVREHPGCPNARPALAPVTDAQIETVVALLDEYEQALISHGCVTRALRAGDREPPQEQAA